MIWKKAITNQNCKAKCYTTSESIERRIIPMTSCMKIPHECREDVTSENFDEQTNLAPTKDIYE